MEKKNKKKNDPVKQIKFYPFDVFTGHDYLYNMFVGGCTRVDFRHTETSLLEASLLFERKNFLPMTPSN